MPSAQSVPASDATKAQVDAAASAIEAIALKDGQGDHGEQQQQHDEDGEEEDEKDEIAAADVTAPANGEAATSSSSKKKKKKSKSKGKGKAALDKLKGTLTGNKDTTLESSGGDDAAAPSSSVAGKKPTPPISDALYRRILEEAKKNLTPEEAAKLDRQSVAEMVECQYHASFLCLRTCERNSNLPSALLALNLRDVISGKSSGITVNGRNKK